MRDRLFRSTKELRKCRITNQHFNTIVKNNIEYPEIKSQRISPKNRILPPISNIKIELPPLQRSLTLQGENMKIMSKTYTGIIPKLIPQGSKRSSLPINSTIMINDHQLQKENYTSNIQKRNYLNDGIENL